MGEKRRGLGPRNDVLTTCKAVTLLGGQRVISVFPTVIILIKARSEPEMIKNRKNNITHLCFYCISGGGGGGRWGGINPNHVRS